MGAPQVLKGLEGVYVTESSLCLIDTENSRLYYAGYDVEELVRRSSYEEVSFLLLNSRLPKRDEFEAFVEQFGEARILDDEQVSVLESVAARTDSINGLASFYLMAYKSESAGLAQRDKQLAQAIKLIAQSAPAVASICRFKSGQGYVKPRQDLSHAANFLYMLTGKVPSKEDEKAIDNILILHAEHGVPASTFGALVAASTLSDLPSSVAAGLLSLKGPLHGGAAEAMYKQLEEIGGPENVERWLKQAFDAKRRIMGMGHRIYKIYDPRAKIVKEMAREVAARHGGKVKAMYETAIKLEEEALKHLASRGIFPNLDFWTPIIYTAVGLPYGYYTALFAASRVLGWVAHILEYWADNRLIRPLHLYKGEKDKKYVPLDER